MTRKFTKHTKGAEITCKKLLWNSGLISLLLLAFFWSGSVQAQTPVAANGQLSVSGTSLVNQSGTPVQLRGMSTHGLQWYESCINYNAISTLASDWGMDVLRLAMYIDEDESGYVYDKAYYNSVINELVDLAEQFGVYAIIDWHVHNPGDPNASLADAIEFWDYMSSTHANKEHVLYEICNEPNGVSWATVKSYAEQVIPVIRANDPDQIIIVGTPTYSQDVDQASNDPLSYDNIMYTLHFYSGTHGQSLRDKANTAMSNGLALFVTEWGTSGASGDGGPYLPQSDEWMTWMNSNNLSWCNWSYADKAEVSAALVTGSCLGNEWNNTTQSGAYVKENMLNPADAWSGSENIPPTGSVTSPVAQAKFEVGETITVQANANDQDGSVASVEFFANGSSIGTDASAPYTAVYTAGSVGSVDLSLEITDNSGATNTSSVVTIEILAEIIQTPYPDGIAHAIPGDINATDFDDGGEGIAYHDVDSDNKGDYNRVDEGVDTEGSEGGNIGYVVNDEWIEYTVNVAATGTYQLELRVASQPGGGQFRLEFNGVDVTGVVDVPTTGNWASYQTLTIPDIGLSAGEQVMRMYIITGDFNFADFSFTSTGTGPIPPIAAATATPTSGTAPLVVALNGSGSSDSDGSISTYAWNFGDGSNGSGSNVTHTYGTAGSYTATLTVTDNDGQTDQASVTITVTTNDPDPDPDPVDNIYTQRFLDMYEKIYDPANGYFSADGLPYHSVESLIVEAPDHGHETTSEAYSYWIWIDAMYGGITGDWSPLSNSWSKMEQFAIPTDDLQPTTDGYNPNSPATFAAEHPFPTGYPSPLESDVPVGEDPMSPDLTATYGSNIYGMHWLFDLDNFYGYGNKGDGTSTASYINTFQRGEQESCWETVPHPCWDDFSWGSNDGSGFLSLFVAEDAAPAAQWKYTNAPDADARAVQAMYWATQFAKDQGLDPATTLPLAKASKMGDFVRLAMCDKYFKPIGVQDKMGPGGTGYESAHYLISWYYAWGGPLESQGWAWRIGSSHNHFGYQNPVAAYALSQVPELQPISQNGVRDWSTSLDRQIEFYTWLQSAEGGIAGGATNSLNGVYDAYPAGTATFYGMAYDDHPVYHDPGSNQWFGMQAWSMERIAELYYITNDPRTKSLMDKWVSWVKSEVQLPADGSFAIPSTLEWTGQPETWDPANPQPNTNLHVNVLEYGEDLGIAGCLAKALTYYAAATEKYETLDEDAKYIAKELLDRMWNNYYEPNGKGVAAPEPRGDFSRFFEQEVYIPEGWSGTMANGDVIEPGVTFLDIRSKYRDDPDFPALEAAYNAGEDYVAKYHRFWGQADIMLANAEFGRLFPEDGAVDPTPVDGVILSPASITVEAGQTSQLTATVTPSDATDKGVSYTTSNSNIASVSTSGMVTGVSQGSATITVTTDDGGFTDQTEVTVTPATTNYYSVTALTNGNGAVSLSPAGGTYAEGTQVTITATADAGNQFDSWSDDASGSVNPLTVTVNADLTITANFSLTPVDYYTLTVSVVGNGNVSPTGGSYEAGTVVTLTATADIGNHFDNWSGDASGTATSVSIIMNSNKSVIANFSPDGGGCDTETPISMPFSKNGAGEFCYVATGELNYFNSWNMDYVEVNGQDYTNVWGNNPPTSADGKFHIRYEASVAWAHFEIDGTDGEVDPPVEYSLLTSVVGQGSVSPSSGTYEEGTSVTLTATADAGYVFDGWSGDASGTSASVTITMDSDKSVSANFSVAPVDQFIVSTSVNGSGSISLSPAGGIYDAGTIVTITANPGAGYQFDNWSGALSGSANPATITVNSNVSVVANFSLIPSDQFTVSAAVSGSGSVSLNPAGGIYDAGTVVSITATAASGNQFDNWSGDLSGSQNPASITINSDMNIVANFSAIPVSTYTLSTSVSFGGSIVLSPAGGTYEEGTVVTVEAVPAANCTFDGWGGALSGTTNPATITMDANKAVTAGFTCESGDCETISLDFSYNGAGQHCWFTTDDISYINSWATSSIEINGVDYTNIWSNNMPAKQDGGYYINYDGSFGWSHFEATALKSAQSVTDADPAILVYPNPFTDELNISFTGIEGVNRIEIISSTGQLIDVFDSEVLESELIKLDLEVPGNLFLIRIYSEDQIFTETVIRQ